MQLEHESIALLMRPAICDVLIRCFGYVVGVVDLMTSSEVPCSSSSRAMSRSLTLLAVVAVTALLSRGQFCTIAAYCVSRSVGTL